MASKKYARQFVSGIIDNNPTLVQLLGMCPTLATSTSLENAIGMGLAATAVLAASNVVISLLRKLIPQKIRIAAYVVIIASFVTVIDLLMQAYLPSLSKSLGLYIPLIVVNCIILARAEAFASKNSVLPSFVDGLSMGVGFTLALSAIAVVREILGNGTIYGISLFGASFQPAAIMIMAPGGFLTLGLIIALVQKLRQRAEGKERR
ncbi:MAG: electron transport complex subunit E [Clostridiaceae bacterium]|nr:electron transport complex subunit E [Clostridiaceae bacterium]